MCIAIHKYVLGIHIFTWCIYISMCVPVYISREINYPRKKEKSRTSKGDLMSQLFLRNSDATNISTNYIDVFLSLSLYSSPSPSITFPFFLSQSHPSICAIYRNFPECG